MHTSMKSFACLALFLFSFFNILFLDAFVANYDTLKITISDRGPRNWQKKFVQVSPQQSDDFYMPQNLKKMPGQSDNSPLLNTFNEVMGLSEREFLGASSSTNAERYARALALAYRRCEFVTKLFSKTFYMGTSLMRPDARKHVWAIYAWCRRTDDIVDSPRALLNREVLRKDLREWDNRLEKIWENKPVDLFDMALVDTVQKYPALSIQPYRDMIAGMIMDVPGLGQERYANFEELYLYCYRVAGTVGLMTLPILGVADGYTFEEASGPAVDLGMFSVTVSLIVQVAQALSTTNYFVSNYFSFRNCSATDQHTERRWRGS